MTALLPADIIGSWRVVRTEIPAPYNPEHEFFHFSPDGIHAWEYPFLTQSHRVLRLRYVITDSGVRVTNRAGVSWDLPMRLDGDLLVITGPHGYSSWLQRIPAAERPAYLTLFYEPAPNRRNA